MKRAISLFLILVLCLSLAACASQEEKALEQVNSLLAVGDYEGALAVYQSLEGYQALTDSWIEAAAMKAEALADQGDYEGAAAVLAGLPGYAAAGEKIAEYTRLGQEAACGFLFGTWKSVENDVVITFGQGGTGSVSYGGSTFALEYSYADKVVSVTYPEIARFLVSEQDGCTCLVAEGGGNVLYAEADYDRFAPVSVEITLENWEEYFEMVPATSVSVDDFDVVTGSALGYALVLKEEYVDRLNVHSGLDVSFKLEYDHVYRILTGDFSTGEYSLSEETYFPEFAGVETMNARLTDYREADRHRYCSFYGTVAAVFLDNSSAYGDVEAVGVIENPRVIAAQGTLELYP